MIDHAAGLIPMDGRISPASSSSSSAPARKRPYSDRRRPGRSQQEEEEKVACTGKSCQSCTAGVIADCVAVCCCPCAVVNILTLAFVKLPWAVARRCIGGRRSRRNNNKRRMLEEEKRRQCCKGEMANSKDIDASKGREPAESVFRCGGAAAVDEEEGGSEGFGAEEVWWELYEVGHLGFGRVSFTGISFQSKGI